MLNTIKKILQKNKDAYVIIVENNKPVFVVSSFEEYEKMMEDKDVFGEDDFLTEIPSGEEIMEGDNREIINLGAPEGQNLQIIEEALEDLPSSDQESQEEKSDEIRIEDIPLL